MARVDIRILKPDEQVIRFFDISLVTDPIDPHCRILSVTDPDLPADFEDTELSQEYGW